MRRSRLTDPAGFTLIELILALALVSFVCIGLYSIYDGALRVVETVDQAARRDEVTRAVTLLLRNDLLNAYHRKWGEQPQDSPLRFLMPATGQRRQDSRDVRDVVVLEFAAVVSPLFDTASDPGRITRIIYALRPAHDQAETALLVRKELPFAEMSWRSPAAEPWRELVVADKVTSLEVTAYGSGNTGFAAWDSLEMERKGRPALPTALVIQFERRIDGQKTSWSTSISLPPWEFSFARESS